MNLYDKERNMICGVCGDHWSSHGLGGNCNKLPLSDVQLEVIQKVYSKSPPQPNIKQVIGVYNMK